MRTGIPLLDDPRRTAYGDTVWRDIVRDDGIGANDGAITDMDGRENYDVIANPYIVSNDDLSIIGQGTLYGRDKR